MGTDTKTTRVNAVESMERLAAMRKKSKVEPDIKDIIGENLEKIRKSKGFSRKELAEIAGVTDAVIASYECAIRLPPLDKLFAIADALQISIVELTGENSVKSNHLDYRFRRATKLANLANYSVYPMKDATVELELPSDWKESKTEKFFSKWTRTISFKSSEDFVGLMEMAQEKAITEDTTFDNAFRKIITDADKIRATESHIKRGEELLDAEKANVPAADKSEWVAENENDVHDVAQKP